MKVETLTAVVYTTEYLPASCPGCGQFFGEARGAAIVLEEPAADVPVLKKICKKCRRMLFVVASR